MQVVIISSKQFWLKKEIETKLLNTAPLIKSKTNFLN